jgi:hypothetical protein
MAHTRIMKATGRRRDATRLAAAVGVDQRTALRWLDGESLQSFAVANALEAAAEKLGIKRDKRGRNK